VAAIVSDKGKRPLKQDDPAYVEKVFSILHSPPSSLGFNRTSWRQEDIKKVLADNGMPLSRHGIRNIELNRSAVVNSTDPFCLRLMSTVSLPL
jgi:hypothetical protein